MDMDIIDQMFITINPDHICHHIMVDHTKKVE